MPWHHSKEAVRISKSSSLVSCVFDFGFEAWNIKNKMILLFFFEQNQNQGVLPEYSILKKRCDIPATGNMNSCNS